MDTADPSALVSGLIQAMKEWEISASKAVSGLDVSSEVYGETSVSLMKQYAEIVRQYCTADACSDDARTRHSFMLSEPSAYESEKIVSIRTQKGKLGLIAIVSVNEESLFDIGDHLEYRILMDLGRYRVYDKRQIRSDGGKPIIVQI